MQRLGKREIILKTYVGDGHRHLHKTTSGYQFGVEENAEIVTDIEQVKEFTKEVQEEVLEWLSRGGVAQANQARLEMDVAEQAGEMPGTLDALADRFGPSVKANLFGLMKQALQGELSPAAVETPGAERVEGGVLVQKPGGNKEFIPDDNIGIEDDPLEREVPVGVGAEEDGLIADMAEAAKSTGKKKK